MSIEQTTTENLDPSRRHTGGLYDLPVVGNAASVIRDFYDGMAPTESDNISVRVAKEVFRHGSIVVIAAGAAVVML